MLNLDELNKRLSVLVMDCKDNPGKANELMVTEEQYKKIFGEVFTPAKLVNEMLDKLPVEVWNNKDLTWCDPACGSGNFLYHVKRRLMEGLSEVIEDEKEREKWIIENMLYGVELQRKNCYLCMFKLDPENEFKTNIACENSLEFNFWGKKFDVVVGNPPYNSGSQNKGAGNILWDKFIVKALDTCKNDGYICFVNPGLWRKPGHNLWKYFTQNNLIYLEIHNEADGVKTFRANTRYDWYVLQKTKYSGETVIKTETGEMENINITEYGWIPNSEFALIKKLIANVNDEKCKIINERTSYGADKSWVENEKNETFQYPCVYSVNRQNQLTLKWSSTNENGHFGIPKVIFGSGATGFYVDKNGDYALTQWATGIVDEPENLEKIASVLDSNEFKNIIKAMSMSKQEINAKVLSLFRKDFWKEFLPEETEDE